MNIGFIGVGHMGSSLALAIKDYQGSYLLLNDAINDKAIELNKKITNSRVASFDEILNECEYIFIGVKPIDADEVFKKINGEATIISMVAGKTIKEIKSLTNNPIIRILPNTPVAVKSGLTLYNYSSDVNDSSLNTFLDFMKETGEVALVDEDKINPISVVTGSAPAYLDYFIDALIKALVKEGISEEAATQYALKMSLGTIKLDLASNKTPLELGKEVCSPGGSTIEGVNVLLDNNLYEAVDKAFRATLKKNNKMK